jgi:hypothetical protein
MRIGNASNEPEPSVLNRSYHSLIKFAKTAAHIGFVPLVIYLGFRVDPNQSLIQLVLPI